MKDWQKIGVYSFVFPFVFLFATLSIVKLSSEVTVSWGYTAVFCLFIGIMFCIPMTLVAYGKSKDKQFDVKLNQKIYDILFLKFIPKYTELEIFLVSYSILLISLWNWSDLSILYIGLFSYSKIVFSLGVIAFLLSGYHVFTKRKMHWSEKILLYIYNFLVTALAALFLIRELNNSPFSFWRLFAFVNFFYIFWSMVVLIKAQGIWIIDIDNRQARWKEIIIAIPIISVLFGIFSVGFHYHWSLSLSVIIAYITLIQSVVFERLWK